MFDLAKPGHAWLALDDKELLRKLGGYRVDRKTGAEGFTLAGLLMFGKTEAITDEICAPYFFLDYRELTDGPCASRWLDRICPDGTWEANLFQFYKRVLPKLQEILPVPFQLEGDMRKDETSAHVAIREALINALVHADYSINASIVITRSKNEIVFSNPGCLLVSKQQYYEGGDSVCRNPSLQKMFMMLGRAEKAGSGADKIISGWKDSNWTSPNLEEKSRPDKVVLTMPLLSVFDSKTREGLVEIFGEKVLRVGHNKLLTLALALTEGVVSNERLRYTLDLHKYDITQLLKELCMDGYLVSDGIGRGTTYRLHVEHNLASNLTSNLASNLTSNLASNLTSNFANNLDLSKKAKKRYTQNELFDLIKEYTDDWKSLEEIAVEIGRSAQYLKNEVIPKMLESGIIQREYPAIPKHPAQRYKNTEK